MSLAKASVWTAGSTLIKIAAGLLVVKLLAVAYGPAGVGQAGNFRQMVTVLGVLSGAGIFNGVTKYVAEHHQDPARLKAVIGTLQAMVLGFSTLLAMIFLSLRTRSVSGCLGMKIFSGDPRGGVIADGYRLGELTLAIIKGFRDAAVMRWR